MAEPFSVSQDDLLDIMDLKDELEKAIARVLHDQQMNLAMSALIAASIKCVLSQSRSLREANFYRNVFIELIDDTITNSKFKE